ncbi:MAG: DUF5317 family protein [Chloroflexota bacterium]|nr:DUF5317 family protein [Chloroflexota bacterium]
MQHWARRELYGPLLALALVAVQFTAIHFAPSALLVRIVLPATIAAVPVVLWPFRQHLGIWIMFVGLLANLAAVLANGGFMPIDRATVAAAVGDERAAAYVPGQWLSGSKDALIADGGGHAVALGDSLVVHIGRGGFVASAGDLVVGFGLVVLAAEASIAFQRGSLRSRETAAGARVASKTEAEGGAVTSS